MTDRISELLYCMKTNILISDGGLGTMLQMSGLPSGSPPEEIILRNPELLADIHRQYYRAGARLITTDTFGANRCKLSQYRLDSNIVNINKSAVDIARKAVGPDAWIACSIGPTGELLNPSGKMSASEMFAAFKEQAQILKEAGGDLIIIETMSDIGEFRIAMRACIASGMQFIASMSFNERSTSLSGSTPEVAAVVAESFNPISIGANCGLGPVEMIDVVKRFAQTTHIPIIAQPNAGLPQLVDGATKYRLTPEDFAAASAELAVNGASIIGGCCGTTPDHIQKLSASIRGRLPGCRKPSGRVRFASVGKIVEAGENLPFVIVGERINPTGRKKLSSELSASNFTTLRADARSQFRAGAQLLDVNSGVPGVNEPELMAKMVVEAQSAVPDAVISIDSNDPAALESGLCVVSGRPLINSINGQEENLDRLLPLVINYGSNFIALAMDETGIPPDAKSRLSIVERIVRRAESAGISRNRILVDALVFTVGSQPHQAHETIKTLDRITQEFGCATILGVSNVSFGLPAREAISSVFLAMAMSHGLCSGIINPLSARMMETVRAAELLLHRDPGAKKFVMYCQAMETVGKELVTGKKEMPILPAIANSGVKADALEIMSPVSQAVIHGDKESISDSIKMALDKGKTPSQILDSDLIPAIQEVGKRYGKGDLYLPQLVMAGETMKYGVNMIRPMLSTEESARFIATPFILGTVEGDIHDIGKNIVSIVLENEGFQVIDLGKDVKAETFLMRIISENCQIIGLSALMTTTLPSMEKTVKLIKKEAPHVKIMVGGAVVTETYAKSIAADSYAKDAIEAAWKAKKLIGL